MMLGPPNSVRWRWRCRARVLGKFCHRKKFPPGYPDLGRPSRQSYSYVYASGAPKGCQRAQLTLPKCLEGPVRVGTHPTTSTTGPMGGRQELIQEERKMRAAVPLLGSVGPQMAGLTGFHTAGPIRVSIRRARGRLSYGGPLPGFGTAGLSQAFIRHAQACLSYRVPRLGRQSAGPDRTLSRRAPTGPQSAGPGLPFKPRTPAGPSVGGPQPGFQMAGSARLSVV